MLYFCWAFNGDLQQGFVGINTFAVDMLDALPIGGNDILLIAHNSDYDCIFVLEYLENVKPIVNGGRFLQIKATYYNLTKRKNINIILNYNYK